MMKSVVFTPQTAYPTFLSLLLFAVLLALPTYAEAQRFQRSGKVSEEVHASGWTINKSFFGGRHKAVTSNNPTPAGQPKTVSPSSQRSDRQKPSVDRAWRQVWGPIENITGVDRYRAEDYMGRSKKRFQSDSKRVLSNARAWSVIAADLGLVPLAKDVAVDWFSFTANELPRTLASDTQYT